MAVWLASKQTKLGQILLLILAIHQNIYGTAQLKLDTRTRVSPRYSIYF